MSYRFLLSRFTGALLLCSVPVLAQDFRALANSGSQALAKGACKDAQTALVQAFNAANKETGTADLVLRILLQLGAANNCAGDYDGATSLAKQLNQQLNENRSIDSPAARAEIQFLIAEANKARGSYADADDNYVAALHALENVSDADAAHARYLISWADLARLRGQFSDADTRLQQATALLDKTGDKDSIDRANALLVSADLARDRGLWNDARSRYRDALAIARVKSAEHPAVARGSIGLGLLDLAAGNVASAEANLKQAQNIARLLPSSANAVDALDALGLLNLQKNNLSEAEQSLKACLDARGKNRPRAAITLDHVALLYAAELRWADAEAAAKNSAASIRDTLGPDHPYLPIALTHLAMIDRLANKLDQASDTIAEAVKLQTKLATESLGFASVITEQANVLTEQSRCADAERIARKALALEDTLATPQAPMRFATVRSLALALHGEAKDSDAAALIAEWMKARGDSLPLTAPERLPVAVALGEMQLSAKKYSDAEKSFADIVAANEKLGKAAWNIPVVQKDLADALFAEQKWKEASRQYEAALPSLTDRPGLRVSWENLGASYAAQKLWSESLRSYRKALELAKKDRANADIERVTLSLAEVSFDGGNASEGAKYVSEWLPLHNASGDLLTLEEARIVDKAATALSDAKQYAAAEPALRVLLDAGDQPGSHSVNMNRVLLQLAEVYAAENKNAEAAPLYERLGLRNRAIGRLPDAEQYLLKAKNLRDKAPGPKGEGLVAALQELGNTYVQERKFSDAQAAFDQARTILQKNDLATDPRMAISLNGLGAVQEGQSNSEEAAKLYNQAYDLLKQSPDPPAGIMVSVLYHLGSQALAKNNMADAKTYFDQCVAISEKRNYTPENPPPVDQLDMIAGAYERQGNFDQAEKLYKRNLELRTTSFGENSVEQAWGLFSLAVYYNGRKQYDQAVEYGEKALHIFEAKSGEESDEVAFVLSTLANAYGAKGDLQRAMAATARSVDIQEKLKRPRDEITNSLSALGEYSLRSKKYQDALDAYQKLAKLWEPEMFASPNYQRAAANIAATYVYLNDVQDGNQWYDRLQKALQQQHDTMQLPSFARRYADALQAIGHEKDAKKIRDRAGIANNRGRE